MNTIEPLEEEVSGPQSGDACRPNSGVAPGPKSGNASGPISILEIDDEIEKMFFSHRFSDYLKPAPHNASLQFLDTKHEFTISSLARPIGICVLVSENIVVSITGENKVKIFSPTGKFLQEVTPQREFHRPSDMVTIPDGRFAVRDDKGIQLFSEEGVFLQHMAEGYLGKCYGLTTDGKGHLITINSNFGRYTNPLNPTSKGKMDVLLIDINTNEVVKRFELEDIIGNDPKSKCRFLASSRRKIYIVDLGLDRIYILDMIKETARVFGQTGKLEGHFSDPAGIVVDAKGFMIVADANNDRLQIFDKDRKYVGRVNISGSRLRRPSGIYFDPTSAKPTFYVLSLRGNSLSKFTIVK